MKEKAIAYLKLAKAELEQMDPVPEAVPGPEQSERGKAYQALTAVYEALNWLGVEHE
ncbi:MAG: hypothetical protein WBA09_22185 [Candidatus Acidiferrum sp.]